MGPDSEHIAQRQLLGQRIKLKLKGLSPVQYRTQALSP
ncbi:IS3 family transposase [Eoetvoesiella caeni]